MSLSQQILTEFIDNCRKHDLIKARLVLDRCDQIEPSAQKRVLYELNKCDNSFALPLMMYLAVRHEALLKLFPMISEAIRDRSRINPRIAGEYIRKDDPDQIGYIRLVTDLNIRQVIPDLIWVLQNTSNPELQETVIRSLGVLGADKAVGVIAECLESRVPYIIDTTIDTLGKIGNSSAVDTLNRLLKSEHAHIRNRAKYRLVEAGAEAVRRVNGNLDSNDVDLLIHSLNIMRIIGDSGSVAAIRRLINSKPADPNVRFAAYEALADLPMRSGDYILATGLADSDSAIRMAAARAADQHLDDSLLRGIHNLLNAQDEESEQIARAIVDSQSGTLACRLLEKSSYFRQFFIQYLALFADSSLRLFYLEHLNGPEYQSISDAVEQVRQQTGTVPEKRKICVVDDSRLILKVYRSILSELSYEPVLFEKPMDLLFWLKNEIPLAVFTDLNMPDITGIDLIREIRTNFDKKAMPIIMVTTQNETTDFEKAYAAGANSVITKPFDLDKIRTVLKTNL
ncbi:response regulator [bacterium]|nr:response regulator [bacterium]